MSTVLGYPEATSCAATDLLWVTQGTGTDRDKKATLPAVVAGGLPAAIVSFPATTAPTGAETLAVVQAGVGKEISLNDAVKAVAANAPEATVLETSRILVDQTGAKGIPITDLVPRSVDISKRTTSKVTAGAVVAEGGDDMDFDACTSSRAFVVRRVPLYMEGDVEYQIQIRAVFLGIANSSSNNDFARLVVPEAALPTGWFDEIESKITAMGGSSRYVVGYKTNVVSHGASAQAMNVVGSSPTRSLVLYISEAWLVLFPTDNTAGATITADIVLPGNSIEATL